MELLFFWDENENFFSQSRTSRQEPEFLFNLVFRDRNREIENHFKWSSENKSSWFSREFPGSRILVELWAEQTDKVILGRRMYHFCSPAGVSEVILAISEATPSVASCAPLEGCLGIPKHREVESTSPLLADNRVGWGWLWWRHFVAKGERDGNFLSLIFGVKFY